MELQCPCDDDKPAVCPLCDATADSGVCKLDSAKAWQRMAEGLHADNEELRKQVALIPKLEKACSRKEKQVKEAAGVMKDALDELSLAHEDNRRLQKAYDKLQVSVSCDCIYCHVSGD